jgi:hypothetical protein
MSKAKVVPVLLAASLFIEPILSVRHSDTLVPQQHIEFETTVPFATTASVISASGGSVKVLYGTPCKNRVGQFTEIEFSSVEAAKKMPIPRGYDFAFISVEGGRHVWTPVFGWEYHEVVD